MEAVLCHISVVNWHCLGPDVTSLTNGRRSDISSLQCTDQSCCPLKSSSQIVLHNGEFHINS